MRSKITFVLVMSLVLALSGFPLLVAAFTTVSAGFANRFVGVSVDAIAEETNVLILDFDLPDPNNDTLRHNGATYAVAAGDTLSTFSQEYAFASTTGQSTDYEDGEAIFRDDGDGQLEASSTDPIITTGGADFVRIVQNIATSSHPTGGAGLQDVKLSPGANQTWEWGEDIWIDLDDNGTWTTSADVILVAGTLANAGEMWKIVTGASTATTVDPTLGGANSNLGFLDVDHDGELDFTVDTSAEPIVRTAAAGAANGYALTANDWVLIACPTNATYRDVNGNWTEDWVRLSTLTNLKYHDGSGNSQYTDGEDIVVDDDASGYYRGDKLSSVQVQNAGDATNDDIKVIKLWVENGTNPSFQATQDTQIGSALSFGSTITVSPDPGVYTASSKDRIYLSVDIAASPTGGHTIVGRIPVNGIQLLTTNNGPTDLIFRGGTITLLGGRTATDSTAPFTSITAPKAGESVTAGKDYTIAGSSKDSGGSSVKAAKISLDGGSTWQEVAALEKTDNGFFWKYIWQNPTAGTYTLKAFAEDWMGNIEKTPAQVSVVVSLVKEVITEALTTPEVKPAAEEKVETKEVVTPPTEVVAPVVEKPISEMTAGEIKAKITELQQKIIELLNQFIQVLQEKISKLLRAQ